MTFLGAFLIPYLISLVLLGIPLFFLELAIGQRIRKGPIGVWKTIHPYLGGVGVASAIVCLLVCMYYNVILGWCFYYFFASFQDPLPYSSCPLGLNCSVNMECQVAGRTQYFWYNKAIGASSSIEDMGVFQWHLCLVLGFAWIILYLFVNRGVQSAGKVSWQFDFWGRKREKEEGTCPFSLSPVPFPFLPCPSQHLPQRLLSQTKGLCTWQSA